MRKILIGLVALLVLALGALALAPRLIDPDRYRAVIAAELSRATGRPIVIAGPLALSLLPVPTISARDVRLANPSGAAEPDMLRVAAVDLRLAVAPLFSGRIVMRDVTLTDPVLDVERLPDGGMNWAAPPGDAPPATARAAAAPTSASAPVASDWAIDALRVANGIVVYHRAGGIARIDRLDLTASIPDPSGAIRASGSLWIRGTRLDVDLESGALAERTPLHLAIALPEAAAQAAFDGDLATPAGRPAALSGRLKLAGGDAASVLARLGRGAPPELARPFSVAGDLAATEDDISLRNLAVAFDQVHGSGTLRIAPREPGFALTLALDQVDFDRLLAPRSPPAPAPAPTPAAAPPAAVPAGSVALPPGPGAAAEKPAGFAIPADLHGTLDLSLAAMTWRGGLLREGHLDAALDHGAVTVSRAAILLPGGSDLSLSFTLAAPAGAPRADGAVEANSDNLRQLMDWLGVSSAAVPQDRLRRASLSGHFAATPAQVGLTGLDATIDATHVTGAATIALRRRIAFGARLAVDRLNLDAYLPVPSVVGAPPAARPAPAPRNGVATPGAAGGLLAAIDANLDMTIDALTWHGQPARGVHVAGTLLQGALTIHDAAVADLAGAAGTLSGAIDVLGAGEWRARFNVHGPEIGRVLRLARPGLDASGRLVGPFVFQGDLQGDRRGGLPGGQAATALDVSLEALGGTVRVNGEVRPGAPGGGAVDLAIDARHASFAALARTIAPGYQPAGGDPGAVALSGKLQGTADRLTLGDATLALGALTVTGDATLDRSGARPKLSGAITFGDLAVDRFLPLRQTARDDAASPRIWLAEADGGAPPAAAAAAGWSRAALDLAPLGLVDADFTLTGDSLAYGGWRIERPALALTLRQSVLDISRLSGGMFGGSLEAHLQLDDTGDRHATAGVTLRQASLAEALQAMVGAKPLAGKGDFDMTLSSTGRSPADAVASLAGTIRLASRGGTIAGVDLPAVSERLRQLSRPTDLFALFRGLSGGATPYTSLDGAFDVANGVVRSEQMRLVATAGEGDASVTADLPDWLLHARVDFHLTDDATAPPVTLRLDGPLDAPRRVFDVNALEAYLARRGAAPPGPAKPQAAPGAAPVTAPAP